MKRAFLHPGAPATVEAPHRNQMGAVMSPPDVSTRQGSARVIAVLGALVALGPLTIDMYLPALPRVVSDLGASDALVQLTLTGTLLGLGLGQLAIGPLSDALGRRRPLLAGVAVHVIASALTACAADLAAMGALRILQGLGAAAATVVAMAIVRDLFDGHRAAAAVSRLMLVMGVAPVLAPTLGSAVLVVGDWRWVFAVLAVLGIGVIVLAALALPETLPPARRRTLGVRQVLASYRAVLDDPHFRLLVATTALSFAAMFAFVAGSSFVLQGQYGMDEQQFSAIFGSCAVVMIASSQVNPVLLRHHRPERIAAAALAAVLVAGVVLITLQLLQVGGVLGFLLPVAVMLAGGWLVIPNTTAAALSRHGEAAGTAAAVIGAAQFTCGALTAPAVGTLGGDGLATAVVMSAAVALAAVALTRALLPLPALTTGELS